MVKVQIHCDIILFCVHLIQNFTIIMYLMELN